MASKIIIKLTFSYLYIEVVIYSHTDHVTLSILICHLGISTSLPSPHKVNMYERGFISEGVEDRVNCADMEGEGDV